MSAISKAFSSAGLLNGIGRLLGMGKQAVSGGSKYFDDAIKEATSKSEQAALNKLYKSWQIENPGKEIGQGTMSALANEAKKAVELTGSHAAQGMSLGKKAVVGLAVTSSVVTAGGVAAGAAIAVDAGLRGQNSVAAGVLEDLQEVGKLTDARTDMQKFFEYIKEFFHQLSAMFSGGIYNKTEARLAEKSTSEKISSYVEGKIDDLKNSSIPSVALVGSAAALGTGLVYHGARKIFGGKGAEAASKVAAEAAEAASPAIRTATSSFAATATATAAGPAFNAKNVIPGGLRTVATEAVDDVAKVAGKSFWARSRLGKYFGVATVAGAALYSKDAEAGDNLKNQVADAIPLAGELRDVLNGTASTETLKTGFEDVGGIAGSVVGTALGASIGSVVPVAGTFVGGVVGGIGGFMLGEEGIKVAVGKLTSWFNDDSKATAPTQAQALTASARAVEPTLGSPGLGLGSR